MANNNVKLNPPLKDKYRQIEDNYRELIDPSASELKSDANIGANILSEAAAYRNRVKNFENNIIPDYKNEKYNDATIAPPEEKSFLDKLKDAIAKETSGPSLVEQMQNNPNFLKESYDKQMSAPYAALRSIIGKAQEGDFKGAAMAPFTGGANVESAPRWSQLAEKTGITNPTALAAVETAGDVLGSQVGGAPGIKGSIQSEMSPIQRFRQMQERVSQRIPEKATLNYKPAITKSPEAAVDRSLNMLEASDQGIQKVGNATRSTSGVVASGRKEEELADKIAKESSRILNQEPGRFSRLRSR